MDFQVRSGSFKADYKHLSRDILFVRRFVELAGEKTLIDVFPNCWVLGVGDAQDNFSLRCEGQDYEIRGKGLIFIPLKSLLEWTLRGPRISFQAFLCQFPQGTHWPKKTCIQEFKNINPDTVDQILEIIKNDCKEEPTHSWEAWLQNLIEEIFCQGVEPQIQERTLAQRLKTLLDSRFTEDVSLDEISQQMKVSKSYLIRVFRKRYNLTPGEYKKRCRVYFSMYKLLFEKVSTTRAGFDSGYNNLSHFYEYFKETLGVTPGTFKS